MTIEEKYLYGKFTIAFLDDDEETNFYYNFENYENNINPSMPIFEELFRTEVNEINEKYNFKVISKEIKCKKGINYKNEITKCIKNLHNLKIHHICEYIPKWCNVKDDNSELILELKKRHSYAVEYFTKLTYIWLKENDLVNENTVLAVVPSHEASEYNISGIAKVASNIIKETNIQNGIHLITRKTTIAKKSTSFNKPSFSMDVASLCVNPNIEIKNKIVVILDDVTTRGDTFRAVAYCLNTLGVKNIIPLAMGKTVIYYE